MSDEKIIKAHIERQIEAHDGVIRDTNPYTKDMQAAVNKSVILKKWYERQLENIED